MIDPAKIVVKYSGGTADMGDLSFNPTSTEARFWLEDSYALVYIRLHFASGTGTADCAVNVDSGMMDQYDALLYTLKSVGTGTDANFRVPADELMHWTFGAGDVVVLTWTNPDSGNMVWGAEVGLIRVSDIATA